MSSKLHNDPIIYRALGTIRGTYQPSKDDPALGILIADDGVKFQATLSPDIATQLDTQAEKLLSMALWKCYFRTRPATLYLFRVKTENVSKNTQHSFRVNKFQVDGKVIRVNKNSVSVQIKPNEFKGKPFTLTLLGNLSNDLSHRFCRFKLRRKGKSYYIETVRLLESLESLAL